MVETSAPEIAAPTPTAPAVAAVCPYLLADDGRWRSASPSRDHRCTAVVPAAVLAADKQRRLCLVADHVGCATYQVATGHGDSIGATDDPRPSRLAGSAGRQIVRTAPLVLDQGRLPVVVPAITADRRLGQAALARPDGRGLRGHPPRAGLRCAATARPAASSPAAPRRAPRPSATASPRPDASAAASAAPLRTLVPTEVQPSADPEATPAPSERARPEHLQGQARRHAERHRRRVRHDVAVLAELNDIKDASKLRVGQVLELP